MFFTKYKSCIVSEDLLTSKISGAYTYISASVTATLEDPKVAILVLLTLWD
jgi:hypothetical protein